MININLLLIATGAGSSGPATAAPPVPVVSGKIPYICYFFNLIVKLYKCIDNEEMFISMLILYIIVYAVEMGKKNLTVGSITRQELGKTTHRWELTSKGHLAV